MRAMLRYFTEAELTPHTGPGAQHRRHRPALLPKEQMQELSEFSAEFSDRGEVTLSGDDIGARPHLSAFVSFCALLGAVAIDEIGHEIHIRQSGRLGRHVPEILSTYLENSLTLVPDWDTRHLIPEDRISALELLQGMELRRIEQELMSGARPEWFAERPVAFAVFHAKNGKGESCYLFEINKDWHRLNLIGGKQEPEDGGDYLETVRREISEELGLARQRLTLTRLNDAPIVGYSLSGNVGSLARYPCVLYGVRVDGDFNIRMKDRWLTESTIRDCRSVEDSPILVNPQYLEFLLSGNPSRLSQVPLSTAREVRATPLREFVSRREPAPTRWARVARENKDLVAAVLTLVAAIAALVVAF